MINRVILAGRVLRDPQQTSSPGGTPLAAFSLEVHHPRWGQRPLEVSSIEVQGAGPRLVELLTRYLHAGRDVQITGHLRQRDRQTWVAVEAVTFLEHGLAPRCLWSEAQPSREEAPPVPS